MITNTHNSIAAIGAGLTNPKSYSVGTEKSEPLRVSQRGNKLFVKQGSCLGRQTGSDFSNSRKNSELKSRLIVDFEGRHFEIELIKITTYTSYWIRRYALSISRTAIKLFKSQSDVPTCETGLFVQRQPYWTHQGGQHKEGCNRYFYNSVQAELMYKHASTSKAL